MWTLFCNPHRNNGDSDDEGNSSTSFLMNKGLFEKLGADENPTDYSHQEEGSSACWSPSKEYSGHRRTDTMTTCPTSDIEDRGFDDDECDDFDDGLTLQYSSDGCCSFNSLEFEMLKAHVESKFQNQQINYFGEMSCVSSCSSYGDDDEADREWGDDDGDVDADDEQEERPVFLWTSYPARSSYVIESSSDNESSLPLPAIEIDHRFGDSASVVSRFSSSVVDDLAASGHGSSVCIVDDVETECESSSSR